MPWFSFGRKNVGYLYAIANGAKVIWDFDDDNLLKFWMKGASPDYSLEIDNFIEDSQDHFEVIEPEVSENQVVYNPYYILGATQFPCWPRGFPLEKILEPVQLYSKSSKMTDF